MKLNPNMDLIEWIAASKRLRFVSDRDEAGVRAELGRYRPRGFITDFVFAPLVARTKGDKIRISRVSSFWGRFGVRATARIMPAPQGSRIEVRLWHPPFFTAWLCFGYGLAALAVLGAFGGVFCATHFTESVVFVAWSLVMGCVWAFLVAAMNAMLRVQLQPSLQELVAVFSSFAEPEGDDTQARGSTAALPQKGRVADTAQR